MKVKFRTWNYAATFYFWPAISISGMVNHNGYFITISFLFRYVQISMYTPIDEGEEF